MTTVNAELRDKERAERSALTPKSKSTQKRKSKTESVEQLATAPEFSNITEVDKVEEEK